MKDNKRVLQVSLDIIVGSECDGVELAEEVANELERRGFTVVGAGFQEDMTECYEKQYTEILKDLGGI
jgi:ribose 5-phosphate isomerase RpiB